MTVKYLGHGHELDVNDKKMNTNTDKKLKKAGRNRKEHKRNMEKRKRGRKQERYFYTCMGHYGAPESIPRNEFRQPM